MSWHLPSREPVCVCGTLEGSRRLHACYTVPRIRYHVGAELLCGLLRACVSSRPAFRLTISNFPVRPRAETLQRHFKDCGAFEQCSRLLNSINNQVKMEALTCIANLASTSLSLGRTPPLSLPPQTKPRKARGLTDNHSIERRQHAQSHAQLETTLRNGLSGRARRLVRSRVGALAAYSPFPLCFIPLRPFIWPVAHKDALREAGALQAAIALLSHPSEEVQEKAAAVVWTLVISGLHSPPCTLSSCYSRAWPCPGPVEWLVWTDSSGCLVKRTSDSELRSHSALWLSADALVTLRARCLSVVHFSPCLPFPPALQVPFRAHGRHAPARPALHLMACLLANEWSRRAPVWMDACTRSRCGADENKVAAREMGALPPLIHLLGAARSETLLDHVAIAVGYLTRDGRAAFVARGRRAGSGRER